MAAAPLILMTAASLASAGAKETQSKIEQGQAEVAASQEELRLTQREADRKDRLASKLASQNAMAGARGIAAFEGSPLAIVEDSIQREQTATERDRFQTNLTALAIRSGAKIKRKLSQANTQLGLLQQGASLAQTGG